MEEFVITVFLPLLVGKRVRRILGAMQRAPS
jgi:hypothetical protein